MRYAATLLVLCASVLFSAATAPQPQAKPAAMVQHVVLITLDGVRTEEIFGGLDREIFGSTLGKDERLEEHHLYQRFWAETPQARREKLMPFLWGTLLRRHGSIAGNQALGSRAVLTNRHRFSYPGYAELMLGVAHDDIISSNANRFYPYQTVLEFVRGRLGLEKPAVAVFGSWETFNWIAQHEDGVVEVNAGYETYETPDAALRALSDTQFTTLPPWSGARYDVYTFRFALDHLTRRRPRFLYVALDETDDWAHNRRYDRVLEALHRTDAWLKELWTWIEGEPAYKGRTALVITTDHGRGRTTADWSNHGAEVEGAQDVWQAFVVPGVSLRGEWRGGTVHPNQIAATMARWLGLDFVAAFPDAGKPIERVITRAE